MVRPIKNPEDKKTKRMTLYLTEKEASRLDSISDLLAMDKTKIATKAIDNYIRTLENPPEVIVKARQREIMDKEQETLRGYVCSHGHSFFTDWTWPTPPKLCPICGNSSLRETWDGIVKRGL